MSRLQAFLLLILWPILAFEFPIQLCQMYRMGLGAVALWVKGHLDEEMPRYLYQRLRSYPFHVYLNHTLTFTLSFSHFQSFTSMRRCLVISTSDSGPTLSKFPWQNFLDHLFGTIFCAWQTRSHRNVRWAKKGVTEESSWVFCYEMQKEIFVQVKL